MDNKSLALAAIRKKLLGKKLSYKEIFAIMDEISSEKLGNVLTTYFAASGYSNGFSNEELYFLTKAMVETGEKLHFRGIVADKHSIGGVPGTRTTFIVIPIIAAAGFKIPKSSSRAITTPDGTADDMEVLAPVLLTKKKIYEVVKKTNACIVWGGSVKVAPADDIIIQVEKPLLFESFDKILVSIMAKKIAFGSNHVVIDLPYGEMVKVNHIKDAEILKGKFEFLAKKFNMEIKVLIHKTDEPAGRGIGPFLETREALRVLQQKKERPLDLEIRGLNLAANLLEICLKDSPKHLKEYVEKNYGNCFGWANEILKSGRAFEKMQEIIKAQGGNPKIDSEMLKPAHHFLKIKAERNCEIKSMNSKNLTYIARLLGAPDQKKSGIYLDKKMGEKIHKGDVICTLYSENVYNIREAKDSLKNFPFYTLR